MFFITFLENFQRYQENAKRFLLQSFNNLAENVLKARREAEKCLKIIRETTKSCPGCRSPTEKAGNLSTLITFFMKLGPHDILCKICCFNSAASFSHAHSCSHQRLNYFRHLELKASVLFYLLNGHC